MWWRSASRRRLGSTTWLVVGWAIAWSVFIGATCTPGIKYVYDANGRLIAVVDDINQVANNAAIYHYDAAGNITSIERLSGNTVRVLGFAPSCGSAGTTVTISGTGLVDTNSTTTVKFNGTTATLTSQDDTRLVATVPAGATSGLIQVTVGANSSNSATAFAIGCGGPTITDLQPIPRKYAAGASVSILGSNFKTAALDNRVRFNGSEAQIVAPGPTATTITAKVPPSATSGRVTVSTREGAAVSPVDYFIAPPDYTSSQLDFGSPSRITPTATTTVTITAAGNVGLVLFDAVAGERVSILVDTGSKTLPGWPEIQLYSPAGNRLSLQQSFGWFDAVTLPETGTYTIGVPGASTGSITFTVYAVPPDVTSNIAFGTPGVTVNTTVPGQNARLRFSGTAGQRVSVTRTNTTYPNRPALSLIAPDGSTVELPGPFNFTGPATLPLTGTYSILVDPSSSQTGGTKIILYDVPPDISYALTLGTQYTVPFVAPGQRAILTFSGTLNQRVSVHASGSSCNVVLRRPNETPLADDQCGSSFAFFGPVTLLDTGEHSVLVEATDELAGTISPLPITVYNVVDYTGSIPADGAPTTAPATGSTIPGQAIYLTFNGTEGQRVSLQVTSETFLGGYTVELRRPSTQSVLGTVSNESIDTTELPADDTYTIYAFPWSRPDTPGSITLRLFTVPADVTGTLTSTTLPVTITTPGQNALLSFSGTMGQLVTVRMTNITFCPIFKSHHPIVTLIRPDVETPPMATIGICSGDVNLPQQTLPVSGLYKLKIDPPVRPDGATTGSVDVRVTTP